ncbi:MAG TPA: VOC family protein [Candidatus Binatus sp.]|uniref:VOC family protein n=1 Tax=Candidatus Binatus sp. TaxID=2811406 RepID=UPI002B461A37|nr:VOC family protein [Candidatus Binatus sp.]HKN13210.1 VOC family protein [Candidatus Binatus sp.]
MANPPIGKLDHIGIAVKSVAEARGFFENVLGATFAFEAANEAAGFKLAVFDLSGLSIELLEPLGTNSFLHKFLEKRGEGVHHLTFNVPDCKKKTAELKEQGVRIVDETNWSPTSFESFISPRSSHGVLIQLGSGYPTLNSDSAWTKKKD